MRNFLLLLLIHISCSASGQPPVFKTSSEILHDIKSLKTVGTVLYIAAHPDDENTRLISYLTKEKGYRVAYLSLTRGEGGQNLIGDEQGNDLGILRTQELLAARRIDGAEQYFTTAYDFGYSKTPEETFRKWNKEELLQEIVYMIRMLRPDLIICRFPTTGEGGHGHHTASAILAEEAYDLAADPEKYKEFELPAWGAKRLLWNTFNFGSTNTTDSTQLKINVGGFNALLGKSYGEIAAEARSQHRCQAFGTERRRGDQFEYFKTIKGDAPKKELMDGVNTTLSRIDEKNIIGKELDKIIAGFNPDDPSKSVIPLVNLYLQIEKIIGAENFRKQYNYHRKKILNTILQSAGIYTEIISSSPFAVQNKPINVKWNFIKRSDLPFTLALTSTFKDDLKIDSTLIKNKLYSWNISLKPRHINSIPYAWASQNRTGYRPLHDFPKWWSDNRGMVPFKGEFRYDITVTILCNFQGIEFPVIDFPVQHKYIDPSYGEIYQPLVIAPFATANFTEEVYILKPGEKKKVTVQVRSFSESDTVSVSLIAGDEFNISPLKNEIIFNKAGELREAEFIVENINTGINSDSKLIAEIASGDRSVRLGYNEIAYEHIPKQITFADNNVIIRSVDFQSNIKEIGYITGAGDKVSTILTQLGFNVTLLHPKEITYESLRKFETVITGVRAFNTLEEMKNIQPVLMSYVKGGGILLMQYNTSNGLLHKEFGPYPFELSRDRVTEEESEVKILKPNDPVLNYPNKITAEDFSGWVQEYGLYFPAKADTNYRRVISMADEKSPQLENSILIANYGKGKYVYTSLSFFRQLPAGIPGAIRLFVNLISRNEIPVIKVEPQNETEDGKKRRR